MKDFPPMSKRINSKFLYYDYELCDCFNAIKTLYDIFKRVKKRFDRKDTLTISKSVADWLQLKRDSDLYPYVLYDFKCNSSRICIIQHAKRYYVYVNVPNSNAIYKKYECDWKDYDLYGGYERLSDCVSLYISIVNFVCVNGESVEVPF